MSWASRRKFAYVSTIFLVFFIPTAFIAAVWWYKAPTCFDGVLNQSEFSIDKGGPCQLLDERQLTPYSVLWTRSFTVRPGLAGATTYIENPNKGAGVKEALYRMRLYDEKNVLVVEKEGVTSIMPGVITPVFAGSLSTGSRVAARAFFEFTGPLVWERLEDTSYLIDIRNKKLSAEDTQPRVEALVTNESSRDAFDVIIIATVFDSAGNAFASSQTVIPVLSGKQSQEVTFTWPDPFKRKAARVDVLPVMPPAKPK